MKWLVSVVQKKTIEKPIFLEQHLNIDMKKSWYDWQTQHVLFGEKKAFSERHSLSENLI